MLEWELDLDLDLDADLDADWRILSRLRSMSGVREAGKSRSIGGVDVGETVGFLGLEMGVRRTGCCRGSVRRRFILLRR